MTPFIIIGKASTLSQQLADIARYASFINQSEEANTQELHSHVSPASGGVAPRPSTNFQDVDTQAPNYSKTISYEVLT